MPLLGHKTDITALRFLEPFPLLASSDFGGNVAIWVVPAPSGPAHRHQGEVLTRFINMQSLESSAPVNCVDRVWDPDAQELTLYTGDEDGDVRVWSLSRLLTEGGVEACAPKESWDAHRKAPNIDSRETSIATARRAVAPETPELKAKLSQVVVHQVSAWKAHADSVRSLFTYLSPECIVTAGYDNVVKIWTFKGEFMSLLRAYGSTPWNFPVPPDADEGAGNDEIDRIVAEVCVESEAHSKKPKVTAKAFDIAEEIQRFRESEHPRPPGGGGNGVAPKSRARER